MDEIRFIKIIQTLFTFTVIILLFSILLGTAGIILVNNPTVLYSNAPPPVSNQDANAQDVFTDSIHTATGFIQGEHLELVIANCTGCHSSKLIIQNRATREGWEGMIKWMQKTQNLPDLGENEGRIVEYLSTYYAPENQGRRKPLAQIEWYELE